MGTKRYGTGPDFGAAGDWSPNGNPADNDECFYGEDSPSMTGTMDQGGIDLDVLYTHRLMINDVGASGSPLTMAADLLVIKGAGGFYYECSLDAGSAQITDLVRIACAQADAIVELGSETGDAGTYDKIEALRGNITLKANIEFGASCELEVDHIDNRAGDVHLTIVEGADTLPVLTVRGGTVICNGPVTLAHIHDGVVTQDKAEMDVVHVFAGGKLIYNHASAGTAITVYPGGWLDINQTAEQKTLTINRYERSIVIPYDDSIHTITENWL